jgi:hypothetical protein
MGEGISIQISYPRPLAGEGRVRVHSAIFEGDAKSTKVSEYISPSFVSFVSFVVKKTN